MTPADLTTLAAALCLLVAPLALAGLALMNAGFSRSRSAAHAVLSALVASASAAIGFLILGCAFFGAFFGAPSRTITVHGLPWGLIGSAHTFLRGVDLHSAQPALAVGFLLFAAALVAVIPLGSGADRWRLYPMALSAALVAAIPFAIFAHWIWGGGWLSQIGAIDAGGSSAIAAVGGLSALSITWLLGPRQGKYDDGGMALPGHNMVMVLFGCLLTFAGWIGITSASALLFGAATPASIPLIAANTLLAASAGLLATLWVTRSRYGKADASLCANGFLAGMVAVGAGCHLIVPVEAAAIGLAIGVILPFSVEWLDILGLDDPSGAITVFGIGGLWGTFAAGALVHGHAAQWLAQLVVISALLGMALPVTHLLHLAVNLIAPQRVSAEGEQFGLDLHELGAGAYPELQQVMKDHLNR